MQEHLEQILFDERTTLSRPDELSAQISTDYRDRELTGIAVLRGSLDFMENDRNLPYIGVLRKELLAQSAK